MSAIEELLKRGQKTSQPAGRDGSEPFSSLRDILGHRKPEYVQGLPHVHHAARGMQDAEPTKEETDEALNHIHGQPLKGFVEDPVLCAELDRLHREKNG